MSGIKLLQYPTIKSAYRRKVSVVKPESSGYEQIFTFLEQYLGINPNDKDIETFTQLISNIFQQKENQQIFNSYMNTKTQYEALQYNTKKLFANFIKNYAQETGVEFPFLDQDFQSAADLESILLYVGFNGLGGGISDTQYGQLRKIIPMLSQIEKDYSQKLKIFQQAAEHSMSKLRTNLYNFEQQKTSNGMPIEDQFSYAFFRTFKGSDGIEKIKVDFLDAHKVAQRMLSNEQIHMSQNFGKAGFFRSASLQQTKGFTEEDFKALASKDTNLQNLATKINNDTDFLNAIQSLSQGTYQTNKGTFEKIGLGRAADILFREYDYETGWTGNFPKVTNTMMNENMAGLLLGDKTIDIFQGEKIIRHQISVKTQDYNNILIDYASSNIIESMYMIGNQPSLLASVFKQGGYSAYGYNGLKEAAFQDALFQGWYYNIEEDPEAFLNMNISNNGEESSDLMGKLESLCNDVFGSEE